MADWTPQSRVEEILFDTINGEPYDGLPQSRIEELLLELKEVIEQGGGTNDYDDLLNQPKINDVTLKGNKSLSDLGIASASALANKVDKVAGKGLSTNDYSNEDKAIVGGVTAALADKVDKVAGKSLSSNDFTDAYKTAIGDNTTAISGIKNGEEINSFGGVESALALKQNATDNSLDTEAKTIVGAINELECDIKLLKGTIYAFHINGAEGDPASKVTYLKDAIGMRPAKMDYTNGVFDYGSWKDAFFMPRPCMVRQNGTVDYYLKEDDYTKKADGTASDVADTAYDGNAMMEWGRNGKKIWMKIEPDSGNANSCTVYIADHRVNATYHDWSFHNCKGVSVDHFYTPIYNGSAVSDGTNNVLRSLSGQYISYSQIASTEITMAGRNNAGSAEIWGTEVYADIVLINMLLTLIGKSTNTQGVFGRGLDDGGENAMKAYVTGALNDKGLFFGYNDRSHGVKVFGMENWWACQWRRYRGHIMVDGVQKVKLTYGTEDGSTAAGYNLTGDDYISVGATPTGTNGQYCDEYEFSPNGAFPKDADNTKATAATHYCDGFLFNNSGAQVPYRGGRSGSGSFCGAWYVALDYDASRSGWSVGAALSCKPLA